MAKNLLLWFLVLTISICHAVSVYHPISDSHRSAAMEHFRTTDGSFGSLEETYEALRTFEVLGIGEKLDIHTQTCPLVSEKLKLASPPLRDLFYALRINLFLRCKIYEKVFEGVMSRLQDVVENKANSLLDFHYSIGGLVLIKEQISNASVSLKDANGLFRSIKALSQSDGRWRFSSNNPESSTFAAGLALEALAGVVSLASSDINPYLVGTLKDDILKLFDNIEKYDDGTFYFDEKNVGANGHEGPLSTTSSIVRGVTAFAAVTSGSLNLPGSKILGLAKFFLGGVPGSGKDLFYQIDSLASLESNRISIPLILSLPAKVLSLTRNNQLKVRVSTVLGSSAPPLSVKLVEASRHSSKGGSIIESQELKFDPENNVHFLDALPKSADVGYYIFVFEIVLHDLETGKFYTSGGRIKVPIFITGLIKIDSADIAVLDSDHGNVESQQKLDLVRENDVSLSANHLQKLRLSFQLTSPLGHAFKPHQAFLKLTHEMKVEHIFILGSSGDKLEIILDFLGLVEKLYYLSGRYDIQLTIGDALMENSFLMALGHIELDLPQPPEKGARPPPQAIDPYLRYGPKAEISHIFRAPERLPSKELSLAFLGLTLMPMIGFLVGLIRLGANLKNFPTSAVPATFGIAFHFGIGMVLLLYVFFWLKLDLFTTLKILGFLGVLLIFAGHGILSHLASTSAKLKSA